MDKNKKNNNINNKKDDHSKKELLARLGITEQVMANDAKFLEKQNNEANKIEEEKKVSKNEIDDEIGWKKPLELLKNVLFGIFMAISDAIPGYSGGTTLSIIGFYEKLISNAKKIIRPTVKGTWWKYLIWIIPFAIAWVAVLIGVMLVVHKIEDANRSIILVFLFGSFAIFSIPMFVLTNKEKLPTFVYNVREFKQIKSNKKNYFLISLIAFGFLFLLIVSLVIRFAFNGVSLIDQTVNNFNYTSYDFGIVISLLFAGFLSGFCLFIPGISGSLMLFLCNQYKNVSVFISDLISGDFNSMPYIIMLVMVMVLGLISSILVINWVNRKFSEYFYSLSFGLVIGSFVSIFLSLSARDYSTLSDSLNLGLSLAMIPVAIIINAVIFIALNQTGKINFPKLYIGKKTKSC